MKKGTKRYEDVGIEAEVMNADPHRVIQLLMDGFISRLNIAKGHMQRGNHEAKVLYINKATDILNGLLVSLDKKNGGEISEVLDELYRFMMRQLVRANMKNDPDIIDSVKNIMQTIKEGWDEIPQAIKDKHREDVFYNETPCVEE